MTLSTVQPLTLMLLSENGCSGHLHSACRRLHESLRLGLRRGLLIHVCWSGRELD